MFRLIKAGFLLGFISVVAFPAYAWPKYAEKEQKDCIYCHVSKSGGKRNATGTYYRNHDHSFTDFAETSAVTSAQPAKKTGPPTFKEAWSVELPAATTRVTVADVFGDKKPRLLALAGKSISIYKSSPTLADVEKTVELSESAKCMFAFRPDVGKPSALLVPGYVVYLVSGVLTAKAVPELKDLAGVVRFADGTEQALTFKDGKLSAWSVSLDGDMKIKPGREMVMPDQAVGVYSNATIRADKDSLVQLGLPDEIAQFGAVGGIDPRGDKKLYGWVVRQTDDGDNIIVVDVSNASNMMPVWLSPRLTGKAIDLGYGPSPKDSKATGFAALVATGDKGAKRTLVFYALD